MGRLAGRSWLLPHVGQAGVTSLPLPCQAPLPTPLQHPWATADIRRPPAMHKELISDVCENYLHIQVSCKTTTNCLKLVSTLT